MGWKVGTRGAQMRKCSQSSWAPGSQTPVSPAGLFWRYQPTSSCTTVLSRRTCPHSTLKVHPHNTESHSHHRWRGQGSENSACIGCLIAREIWGWGTATGKERERRQSRKERRCTLERWKKWPHFLTSQFLLWAWSPATLHLHGTHGSAQAVLCVSSSESSKRKVQHLCLPGSALMPRTQLRAWHQMASRINKEWALGQERGHRSTRSPRRGGQQHRSELPLQL